MAKKKAAEYISEWMLPYQESGEYELSRTEFVKEGGTWYLRVYVDKLENGGYGWMTSDDCEKVSRYLSEKLDEEDPIKQNYYLEVSSPGLDRLLVKEKDFERFKGQRVEVTLYEAVNGKKHLEGELLGKTDGVITIKDDSGNEISLLSEKTAKINLAVVF